MIDLQLDAQNSHLFIYNAFIKILSMCCSHFSKEIKEYQAKWLQHIQRMDTNRIPKQALQYKPKGRRHIGRPRKRWRDQFHFEDTRNKNQTQSFLNIMMMMIKSSTCFVHYPVHHQEVHFVIVYKYMQPLVSSLSAGNCLVHRLGKNFFLNRCTGQSPAQSDGTRGWIYTITT
jgi:hypothetical protein